LEISLNKTGKKKKMITDIEITATPSKDHVDVFITETVSKIGQKAFNLADFIGYFAKVNPQHFNPIDVINKLIDSSKTSISGDDNQAVLSGCKEMIGWVMDNYLTKKSGIFDILFFPSKENEAKLLQYFKDAKKSILVCVFTISNHHIANALREAHERGLDVRIVTDDLFAAKDESDVQDLAREGIQVRTDDTKAALMHNKFAVIDEKYLITGSYNWTAQATYYNQENVVIIENPHGVSTFKIHFEELWVKYANFNFDKLLNTGVHHTKLFDNQQKEEEFKHLKQEKEEKKKSNAQAKEVEKKAKEEAKKAKAEEKKAKEEAGNSSRPRRKATKTPVVESHDSEEAGEEDEEHSPDEEDEFSDAPKLAKGSKKIKSNEPPKDKGSPKKRQNRAKVAKD
jgi:hypothetical protein